MRSVHLLPDPIPGLQHDPHHPLHRLRRQNKENPVKLQRGQVHRLHDVLHLHCLAGLHPYFLWHKPRLHGDKTQLKHNFKKLYSGSNLEPSDVCQRECHRGSLSPLWSKNVLSLAAPGEMRQIIPRQ